VNVLNIYFGFMRYFIYYYVCVLRVIICLQNDTEVINNTEIERILLQCIFIITDGMEMDEVAGTGVNDAKLPHKPVVYPPTDGPLCELCSSVDNSFFDVKCAGCLSLLQDEATTVSELFAILRQWIPQTQQNIMIIIEQVRMIAVSLASESTACMHWLNGLFCRVALWPDSSLHSRSCQLVHKLRPNHIRLLLLSTADMVLFCITLNLYVQLLCL